MIGKETIDIQLHQSCTVDRNRHMVPSSRGKVGYCNISAGRSKVNQCLNSVRAVGSCMKTDVTGCAASVIENTGIGIVAGDIDPVSDSEVTRSKINRSGIS